MVDPISALDGHLEPGSSGPPGSVGVVLSEVVGFSLFQFAGWPETIEQTGHDVMKASGCDTVPGPGQSSVGQNGTALRIEPLKWWVIRPQDAGAVPSHGEKSALLDLTSSRTWVRVDGEKAAVLLNHFLPLDLRKSAFPDGTVASTAFHHVGVSLWRSGDTFNLLLPRSFAASLWKLLVESGVQYGLHVQAASANEEGEPA